MKYQLPAQLSPYSVATIACSINSQCLLNACSHCFQRNVNLKQPMVNGTFIRSRACMLSLKFNKYVPPYDNRCFSELNAKVTKKLLNIHCSRSNTNILLYFKNQKRYKVSKKRALLKLVICLSLIYSLNQLSSKAIVISILTLLR